MINGLDSKPPTDTELAAAKADGVGLWALYHGSPGDGIDPAHLASDADFQRVRAAGMAIFAYVSGNEDPAAIKAWSQAQGVAICVDVERFIRPDGTWVQPWLDASGAGLYGNIGVHRGRRAAFYVLAWYPTSAPSPASWLPGAAPPPGPCGWQYQGTTDKYGISVDLSFFDDSFSPKFSAAQGELDMASADQILAAVTIMPPRPDALLVLDGVPQTDDQLRAIAAGTSWPNITTQFTAAGEAYIFALVHPELRQTVAQAVAALAKASPVPVDLGTLQGDIAAIKAEEDALKAQLTAVEGNLNAPRPPA